MDSGRSHRVSTGSVRQVARSCTRRALIAWRLGRALRRWPECGLSRPLGVSLSYELLLTRRALSLRSLLRWSPDPDRLVGKAVTFQSRYCTSCESKPLGNGDAVLLSRTPVRRIRTHVSNRDVACHCTGRTGPDGRPLSCHGRAIVAVANATPAEMEQIKSGFERYGFEMAKLVRAMTSGGASECRGTTERADGVRATGGGRNLNCT